MDPALFESPDRASPPGPDVVDSWKSIASYFGVSVRTVQLWEQENGLPVHRQPGKRGRVFAYAGELEVWRASRVQMEEAPVADDPGRPSWRRYGLAAVILAGLCLIAVAFLILRPVRGYPAYHRLQGPILMVFNDQGQELWRHRFPETPADVPRNRSNWVTTLTADLDADNAPEFVFPFQTNDVSKSDTLYCFDASGKPKWTFQPGRKVSTSDETFPNLYKLQSLHLLPAAANRAPRVLVNSRHQPYYPSQFVALDSAGRIVHEYWHSGHLGKVMVTDLDSDGSSEIYLLGICNGPKTTDLVMLDPDGFGGASAEETPGYQILNMPPAQEKARILFPRTRASERSGLYAHPATLLAKDGQLTLFISDSVDPQAGLSYGYRFDSRLRLLNVEPADANRLVLNALKAKKTFPADFVPDSPAELAAIRYLTPLAHGSDVE